ncbi:hypothetical protein DMENIID0001_077810 [Sergentomyia squamirostris]
MDLFECLRSKKVSIKVLCSDLQAIYRQEGLKCVVEFFDLFIRSTGIQCNLDPVEVTQAVEDGTVREFVQNILSSFDVFDDEQFFGNNKSMLSSVEKFIQEFCSRENSMIFDGEFIQALTICLNTIGQYGNEYTNSVSIYYSLNFARDLEIIRCSVAGAQMETIKKQILSFLDNCEMEYVFEPNVCDKIPKFLFDIIKSSNEIYILEHSQLETLMKLTNTQHKNAKDIMTFFDDFLKNGSDSIKMAVLDFLFSNTDTLLALLTVNIVSVQVATAKVILAAQRNMPTRDFLGLDQNLKLYIKMISTNNNMREVAKKFFGLTYKSANMQGNNSQQTVLQALARLCMRYKECLENFHLIMRQVYKFFPPPLPLINEVCESGTSLSFKILDYYVWHMVTEDLDIQTRKQFINTYFSNFSNIASAAGDNRMTYEIVFGTLYKIPLAEYCCGSENEPDMKIVTDFIMSKIINIGFMPTLYMINRLLTNLGKISEYAQDKVRRTIKEWVYKFKEQDDFSVLKYLGAALYIPNVTPMMPEKKWRALLKKTTEYFSDYEIHLSPHISYLILVHAVLLSYSLNHPMPLTVPIANVKAFSEEHLIPYFKDINLIRPDKTTPLILLQAYSLVIINFIVKYPSEGLKYFTDTEAVLYKYVQMIVFGTPPTQDNGEFTAFQSIQYNILNTLLGTLENVCSPTYNVDRSFAKFIFLLAKNTTDTDIYARTIEVIFRNPNHACRLIGLTCFNFTFYPNDNCMKTLIKLVNETMTKVVTDSETKANCCVMIVMNYILDIAKYIRHNEEQRREQNAGSQDEINRLCILKYIKEFLKNCSKDQKDEV